MKAVFFPFWWPHWRSSSWLACWWLCLAHRDVLLLGAHWPSLNLMPVGWGWGKKRASRNQRSSLSISSEKCYDRKPPDANNFFSNLGDLSDHWSWLRRCCLDQAAAALAQVQLGPHSSSHIFQARGQQSYPFPVLVTSKITNESPIPNGRKTADSQDPKISMTPPPWVLLPHWSTQFRRYAEDSKRAIEDSKPER